ncbi:alpha/beta fold hydrolase [Mesorhizobium waimense]|uniref:alpha/beta fold hydrolase n=1 Tax=Mesorhizobium waimense TaxID=1300307 RepID=UPI001FDF8E3C|nr:alpha/beta hydrolase [Mesorhizobium waimense]
MRPIETRYARSREVRIAYQVVGQGSFDLVFVPGFISNLDLHWEDEGYSRLLKRLSAFSRLILFDKRGTGLSDRVDANHLPSLEARMDDVRAVMDAAGSGRAALLVPRKAHRWRCCLPPAIRSGRGRWRSMAAMRISTDG